MNDVCDFDRVSGGWVDHPQTGAQAKEVRSEESFLLFRFGRSPNGFDDLFKLRRSSRNGWPVFFNFSSSRAVQSQSPQAPGLRAVHVSAFAPVMRVLHLDQLKILLQ